MRTRLKTILTLTVLAAAGCLAVASLVRPNGVPMVLERNRQKRELQEQNAELQRKIAAKEESIRNLNQSPSEQDLKIREQLGLVKPKETTFILQDRKK
jgi:cell division protein FtsB